jgi:predicted phosphodiesterase
MRFAAIADIHGNCLALEAVLADIASMGIAEVVNLGDHLSGPLEARRTADMLIERGFTSISGNHDRQLLDLDVARMGASDRFAHAQLDGKHLAWLASLPATTRYRDEVFLCHGTPASDTTYWLETISADAAVRIAPIEDIEAQACGIEAALILCGHTHTPRMVRLRDGRMIASDARPMGMTRRSPTRWRRARRTPVTRFWIASAPGGRQHCAMFRTTTCRWPTSPAAAAGQIGHPRSQQGG